MLVRAKQTQPRQGTVVVSGNGGENVQGELDDLQKKYRMMEMSRKGFTEDSQNTIRMQRQQIEKLKRDNDRLKEDLALETRQAKQANNMNASTQLAKLQDQGDFYTRKIEIEKRKVEELDKQIKRLQDLVWKQRKDMGGINATRENNQQIQKSIRIYENRLDKALVKFNEALAHNKQLRETIDNLRRERVVFDGIYRKLEKELYEKKNKMAQIIEVADVAYAARDQAQNEMLALKQQADKEQSKFENEWAQLGQLIEKDRKMKDFLKNKERERSHHRLGDPALEDETKLKKKVAKSAWAIAKDKANIHLSMERVQAYEEAFAKLQKATKINDMDLLVSSFLQAEDQNFQLFNYVNDLSTEIEKMEDQIARVRDEIRTYQQQDIKKDGSKKQMLNELEKKLQKTEQKAGQYEEKYAKALETVNILKNGIQSIFQRISSSSLASSQRAKSREGGYEDGDKKNEEEKGEHQMMMLTSSDVTESNMMQYLGLIEQRVNDLLHQYQQQRLEEESYQKASSSSSGYSSGSHSLSSSQHITSAMDSLSIDAPSIQASHSDDEDDEDVRVMTREELRAQIGQ